MSEQVEAHQAFGARLRLLREDARLTGQQLAARLGWAGSKVSKIENGRQAPTIDDLAAWVVAVGAPPDLHDDLLADLRTVRLELRTWRRQLRQGTAARQEAGRGLEADTSVLRVFEPCVVPGLLQTSDYAQHVMSGVVRANRTPNDIAQGVRVRLLRQQVLYDAGKQFRFLMTEAALRYLVCPVETLRAQLDRLVTVAGLATVSLGVLPFSSRLPLLPTNGFWIYDRRLVLIETTSAELYLRDGEDLELHERLFDELWAGARHGRDATALIARIAESVEEDREQLS